MNKYFIFNTMMFFDHIETCIEVHALRGVGSSGVGREGPGGPRTPPICQTDYFFNSKKKNNGRAET